MENKKILIIDDDEDVRELVTHLLLRAACQVYAAADGKEGLRMLYQHQPDLVLLDIRMPDIDGLQVCSQIGLMTDVPIILLSSLADDDDILQGLECGAVDYIIKPFNSKILVARIRAALRRPQVAVGEIKPSVYSDGYLTIDLDVNRVQVQERNVKLSATELKLLTYLFENANVVLTFGQILERVWGWEYRDSIDYVHTYISRLRRKLEREPRRPQYLLTVHGIGYRFEKQSDP